ncbi:hypothetical protein ACFL0V_02745 [Nanoarchaeota archaeon]
MKLHNLLLVIGIILLVSGCTETKAPVQKAAAQPVSHEIEQSKTCQDTCNEYRDILNEKVQNIFGVEDYTIECCESDMNRGGFFKVRLLVGGEPIDVFYHSGWCSSGGSDCGWEMSFTSYSESTIEVYDSVKNKFCNKLDSKMSESEGGFICKNLISDTTAEVRNKCLAGEFETVSDSKMSLAIKQNAKRCESSVEKGGVKTF